MKQTIITTGSVIVVAFFAGVAFAQGRHDEKPHGITKSAPAAEQSRGSGTGGRHDEGPTSHGKQKAAKQKDAQKKDAPVEGAGTAK